MNVVNPQISVSPLALKAGGTATVTLTLQASAGTEITPVDVLLMLDRSRGLSDTDLQDMKTAAKQFMGRITGMGTGCQIGLLSFADTADQTSALNGDTAALGTLLDGITVRDADPDFRAAFDAAAQMLPAEGGGRRAVVLFSHNTKAAQADADTGAQLLKDRNAELYCIVLNTGTEKPETWVTAPAADHMVVLEAVSQADQGFRAVAAELIPAGILDGEILETLEPDFKMLRVVSASQGEGKITGERTMTWSMGDAGLQKEPETLTMTFEVQHMGKSLGTKTVNTLTKYRDRAGNALTFPDVQVEITNTESRIDVVPEDSPEPTEILIPGCADAAQASISDVTLQGLGRIVQLDVTVKNVCPGKQIAASIILSEVDEDGKEYPRGVKHVLIPSHTGTGCQDVTLHCVQFSVPEALDVNGNHTSICNSRKFSARVIANYVDTDYIRCKPQVKKL